MPLAGPAVHALAVVHGMTLASAEKEQTKAVVSCRTVVVTEK